MARKMKYEIGPEKLLQAVHDMYAKAHNVCTISGVKTEGCVVRGNGKCISSDSEDLVASFLYANLKNRIPNLYIMVNPNITRKDLSKHKKRLKCNGRSKKSKSVCPDILICSWRADAEYDAVYVLELKQNTGWMRGENRVRTYLKNWIGNIESLKKSVDNCKIGDPEEVNCAIHFSETAQYDIALLSDVNDSRRNKIEYDKLIEDKFGGELKMVALTDKALYDKANPRFVPEPNDESFDYIISRILDAWDAFRKKHR